MNAKSIISIAVLGVGIINVILSAIGITPLDIGEDTIAQVVNGAALIIGAVGTTWFNFNATTPAQIGQNLTNAIKNGEIDYNRAMAMITALINETKGVAGNRGIEGTDKK